MPKSESSGVLHPMRVVVRRSGVSADLLRAWEKRYQAVMPIRSGGGQRLYTESDLERLTLLHQATSAGHSISQIAHESAPRLRALLAAERSNASPTQVADARQQELEETLAGALLAVERFDDQELNAMLRRAGLHLGVATAIESLLAPLMREVGERWHQRSLSPAHEHLASGVVGGVLRWMLGEQNQNPDAPRIAVATTEGERHELGIQIVAAVAASEGWRVIYLGADLPATALAEAVRKTAANILAISLISEQGGRAAPKAVRDLRRALPASVSIIAGGVSAVALAPQLTRLGVTVMPDLETLRAHLHSYRDVSAE